MPVSMCTWLALGIKLDYLFSSDGLRTTDATFVLDRGPDREVPPSLVVGGIGDVLVFRCKTCVSGKYIVVMVC